MSGTELLKQIGSYEKSIIVLEKELETFERSLKEVKNKRVLSKIRSIKIAIEQEITEQAKLKISAYELIKSIDDDTMRCILVYHFVCGNSIQETARLMNFSERHTVRLCNDACKKVDEQYKKLKHIIKR